MPRLLSTARLLAALMIFAGLFTVIDTKPAAAAGCLPAALKTKLSQIRSKFGPVRIVSAHRPGARIAGSGKRSYHASCRAVDFHAPKGKYSQVVAWLKANHSGGVGTYSCGMSHIHIDNGPRVRFHKCVNAKGRSVGKKRYAKKGSGKKKYASKSKKKSYAKASSSKPKMVSQAKPAGKKVQTAQNRSGWGLTNYSR